MTDNELLTAMSDLLDSKLKSELQPIKDDISNMKTDISNMKTDISNMKTDISNMKTDISNMETDISNMKTDISDLKSRISKLEDDVHGIHLHLENMTDKNIQILAENYVPAAKRYIQAVEQIDAMQADIDFLKTTVAKHSEILQKFT